MNTIDTITRRLIAEFGSDKPIMVYCEGQTLVIHINGNDARVYNWTSIPLENIVKTVRNATLKESSTGGSILLNG